MKSVARATKSSSDMTQPTLLQPERNCWRIARADRAAFLIDGEAYYSSLKAALEQAQHSIWILGWDIDSRVELVRDGTQQGLPSALGELLNALVARRPQLNAYILIWDFAMIYAIEREWMPVYKLDWRTHKRLCFRMDDKHPIGASQHQKVVVIDDAIAFVGGLDLTRSRWDTPEHKPDDPRRVDPLGTSYAPFHDVQMIMEGDVAAALGELARERWYRATKKRISAAPTVREGRWPADLEPHLTDIDVGIARTQPEYAGVEETREVQQLYLDMIAAAQRYIYLENQYLTSSTIADALVERLKEKQGPEVVMVLPKKTGGWLEQATMDALRARLLKSLREADHHNRLHIYYPDVPGLDEACICVHSKVMVIDDTAARVGSSNLSNRSMGLDTECDVAVEANGEERVATAIARFRNSLLAEHLGVEIDALAKTIESKGSLIAAVEQHRSEGRTLQELQEEVPELIVQNLPDASVIDPEKPIDPDKLVEEFLGSGKQPEKRTGWWRFAFIFAALLVCAAAWRWTPLGDYLDVQAMADWLAGLKGGPLGHVAAVGIFTLASLAAVPVTALIVVTALVFGPWLGFAYSMAGVLASSSIAYGIGHASGRDAIRRIGGSKINKLSRQLGRRGFISMIVARVVPVAPFVVVNLVAGASHIRLRDFVLGSVLGMTPGLLAMTVFADRLYNVFKDPNPTTIALLVGIVVIIGAAAFFVPRWLEDGSKEQKASA